MSAFGEWFWLSSESTYLEEAGHCLQVLEDMLTLDPVPAYSPVCFPVHNLLLYTFPPRDDLPHQGASINTAKDYELKPPKL